MMMGFVEDLFRVELDKVDFTMVKDFVAQQKDETLNIEFKGSRFFDSHRDISIAVSSFANSAGGILFIGVKEMDARKPSKHWEIDDGIVVDNKHNKEALENIIFTLIQPKVDGIRMHSILLANGNRIFLLDVPQGEIPPYMAGDYRYYKRGNAGKRPMEDYEVKDLIGLRRFSKLTLRPTIYFDKVANSKYKYIMPISVRNIGKKAAKNVILHFVADYGEKITIEAIAGSGHFIINKREGGRGIDIQAGDFSGSSTLTILPSANDLANDFLLVKLNITVAAELLTQLVYPQIENLPLINCSYNIAHEDLPFTKGTVALTNAILKTAFNKTEKQQLTLTTIEKLSY